MPCSSWTTRSPVLRSRKSERKLAQPARAGPARGGAPPRGRRPRRRGPRAPASGSSKPRERTPTRVRIARALADREAVLAEHVGEAVGAAGVARGSTTVVAGRAAEVLGEAAHVAGVGGRRPAGDVDGAARRVHLPHLDDGRGREALLERREGDERLRGLRGEALGAALLVLDRPRPEALGLLRGPPRARSPRPAPAAGAPTAARVAPGTSGHELGEALGLRARARATRGRARARAGPRSARDRIAGSAASTERVAKTSASGSVTRASTGPVARCVSGSKRRRLSTVSPKNSMRTGSVAVRGEDVEDAAAPRHLARAP